MLISDSSDYARTDFDSTESSFDFSDEFTDNWTSIGGVENDHILIWWLSEYDDILRKLVDEYQWAWKAELISSLKEVIPDTVLRTWRDSDPLCSEYLWYHVLTDFAVARTTELDINPRPAERKICRVCGNEFLESELAYSLVIRVGAQNIDVCGKCLEKALYWPGSDTASLDAVTGVLQALSEVFRRPLRTVDLSGRLNLKCLSPNERVLVVQALQVKPSLNRVKDLFGSWSSAIDH